MPNEIKLPFSTVGYYTGYITGLVAQEVIVFLLTGGTGNVVQATNLAMQSFSQTLKGVGKFVKKGAKEMANTLENFLELLSQIRKGSKNVPKHLDELDTKVDDLLKYIEDAIKGKGLYGGKILSKSELEDWAKLLKTKYGTKLEKVDNFDNPNILAQFDPNTNTIRYKDEITEYFMAHESYHAEEMHLIGFDEYVLNAPLKGTKEIDYTNENLIRRYYRERYVYKKLKTNFNKYDLNNQENWHIEAYFYEIKQSLIDNNITIPE